MQERGSRGPVGEGVRKRITASPSGGITAVAVSEDGRVAATIDDTRSVRLWPSLDGTQEPVVVAMRMPAALAVTRDGNDVVIAGLDDAGQLELVRTTAIGEMRERIAVDTERAFVAIHAAADAIVAQRDDGAIALFDLHGVAAGELTTEPGQRLASIATQGGHALAMLDIGGKVRGRWIERGPLRWGELTPVLPIEGEHVALSPDRSRIAGVARGGKSVTIVKLANGRVLARPSKPGFPDPSLRPIGFLDNSTLALVEGGAAKWWYADQLSEASFVVDGHVADGHLIGGFGSALAISSPEESVSYLGYQVSGPTDVLALDDHFLITDGTSVVELDSHLHTRKSYGVSHVLGLQNGVPVLKIIDERHVVLTGYSAGSFVTYVVDLAKGESSAVTRDGQALTYDRGTRLLAWQRKGAVELARFDPKQAAFGKPATFLIVPPTSFVEVKPLAPEQSQGNEMGIVSTADNSTATISWVRIGDDQRVQTTRTREVHLSTTFWQTNGVLATLVNGSRAVTATSPDRTLTASIEDQRITLRDGSGVRWSVPASGARDLVWTPSGELFAYGAGMVHVDRASGRFDRGQCGWTFGKSSQPPVASGIAMLCEAE